MDRICDIVGPVPRPCWICGEPSDSREHKIKRSDIVREFGTGAFTEDGGLVHCIDGYQPRVLQGPNSDFLKYVPVICRRCNSNRSQPWDKAYTDFLTWVFENRDLVFARRCVNLFEVFGERDAIHAATNLYKYFVKAFGCRLASAGHPVPEHLVALLSHRRFRTKLRLTFAIYKAVFALGSEFRQRACLSPLDISDDWGMEHFEQCFFRLNIGWLIIGWNYDIEAAREDGAPWSCDAPIISIGEIEGPTLDKLIAGARRSDAPALPDLEAMRNAGGIRIG
ncbi:MAG: hypothetical protein ACKVZJ_02240 [Phycisphaerales bacterium]